MHYVPIIFQKHPMFLTRAQDSIQERRLSIVFCTQVSLRHMFVWEHVFG